MHELPIIKSIFDICVGRAELCEATRIVSVTIRVGDATDLQDEWIQRYFDYLSSGTIAEGAKLKIEREPLVVSCRDCSENQQVDVFRLGEVACPKCGGKQFAYVSGRAYRVESMEVT